MSKDASYAIFCCIMAPLYLECAALDAGIAQLVEQLTCNQ